MTFKIINNKYRTATGPNGNVYICQVGKPHLIYSIEAAILCGIAVKA